MDSYRDEEGEPIMDYDDIQSDPGSPEPRQDLLDDVEDDMEDWGRRERSQTPVYDTDKVGKPRKRLVKKGGSMGKESMDAPELLDEDEDANFGREGSESDARKRKKKEKSLKEKKYGGGGEKGTVTKLGKSEEVNEMWEWVNPENDQEGVRTMDDDDFIDDSGVDPADRYGSDNEARSPGDAPQAEEDGEDPEIKDLFKMGKKRKKNEKSPAEIALLVENVMAELEVTAEEDAELNRQGKPAINKLKKLPLLTEVLSKKQLQPEFLDHGVLTLLKNWLEPLPDGSLPNINIRAAILRILTDFPIDLEQHDRREQLKRSGLGKVIMFLSKSDEETTSNRKLAKDLVDKWSRPIFNKSTRFEDMRNIDDDRVPLRRPSVKRPANRAAAMESRDGDFDLDISRDHKSGRSSSGQHASRTESSSRLHASRPEATPMDFVVRPQSKIDPDEIRARAKQVVQDQRRQKMSKKLLQLKAPKKKQLQATKLSVEGRGMLKYL
ncbi:PREDICTED: transcription factor IWS1 [Theobroma cacao]|uniref:Transcription factor IWS1 n=1 Tax=Theobroma cacao TaxID=3641 RepID=A0AB32W2R6_THECC|nr:PREDICTED: transcription factor IWS1 [Theobroma cacao]